MEVSQNTHYAIDNHITETFELSNLIYIIVDNYGLDVDRLLDLCYEPDYEAMTVCVARIMDRIEEKVFRDNQPNFYKMLKKNVSYEEWKDYYNNFLFFAKKNTKLERIA